VLTQALLVVTTVGIVGAGLIMIGFAIRAYARSQIRALAALAIGFTLIVGASISASVSALLTDFRGIRMILLFQTAITFGGYLVIGYAVYSFKGGSGQSEPAADETPGD